MLKWNIRLIFALSFSGKTRTNIAMSDKTNNNQKEKSMKIGERIKSGNTVGEYRGSEKFGGVEIAFLLSGNRLYYIPKNKVVKA